MCTPTLLYQANEISSSTDSRCVEFKASAYGTKASGSTAPKAMQSQTVLTVLIGGVPVGTPLM